ncbi:MAG: riboflavin synthase [Pelagibacterales bacterium]|nr:riboflavin synthase [Pelagibacterales bacterium]
MFSGIVEAIGVVEQITEEKDNIELKICSQISSELREDQSVSHNGVCLTVTKVLDNAHFVTAIRETLGSSNLSKIVEGDSINLERSLKLGERIDGHLVQGHVDQTGKCVNILDENGSWVFTFQYQKPENGVVIHKGSIAINGVSLTVSSSKTNELSVAVIPYTYENTTFRKMAVGSVVNIEFDVLGKYVFELKNGQKKEQK